MALFSRKKQATPSAPSTTLPPALNSKREERIFALGSEMLQRARGHKSSLLSAKFYSDALMEWSMKDPNFKVQMFRFVDCFPQLKTPEQIFDHLNDYLTQPGVTIPGPIAAALKAGAVALGLGGQLLDPKALAARDFAKIRDTAKQYVEIVRKTRDAMKA